MADDRNNPNTGGRDEERGAPGRNPNEQQSTTQRGEMDKDQGLGQGQQGNRERNEQGFEKGGSQGGGEQRGQI